MSDFIFQNHGTIFTVTPVTRQAKKFVKSHVEIESWQWFGQSFAVEPRRANALANEIVEAGFTLR